MKITKSKLKQIIKEELKSALLKEGVDEVYKGAGLTIEEIVEMPHYINGSTDFYGTSAFQKLYTYYLDSGEMPYGVAKARTGDPDVWILETLEAILEGPHEYRL
tara:strand:- start:665 stop:976 length:312 start_codon:yes stop_codon:yes gene_type:complete